MRVCRPVTAASSRWTATWVSTMGERALHILGLEPVRVGLAAEGLETAQDPVARGPLGAVEIAIRAGDLAHRVHQREAGILAKFRYILTFHNLPHNIAICGNQQGKTQYMDKKQAHFPYLRLITTISGKSVRL